ncbi:MAG: hypothetical protein AAFR11_01675 [Pseudomonadota bacterium]
MSAAIIGAGMATPVGLSAPAACAAIRCRLSGFEETRFIDKAGEWLIGAETPLAEPWRGEEKLARMALSALKECLALAPAGAPPPALFLCVSERERPGRPADLGARLFFRLQRDLGLRFDKASAVVEGGRAGGVLGLQAAQAFFVGRPKAHAILLGTDSLLSAPVLAALDADDRLLSGDNSNGFIPGEAAAAVLMSGVGAPGALEVAGIGLAREPATISSGEPLRADGLRAAIFSGLGEAGIAMHDVHWRMTDISGEQYYFKEAALALSRTLKQVVEEMDIEHPAECVGETGAAALPLMLGATLAAQRKGYAKGPSVLAHLSADDGARAAIVLQYRGKSDGQ